MTITKNQGRDFNHFQKTNVSWSTFGGGNADTVSPDQIIKFSTVGVMLNNEGSGTIEFSLNGTTIHGELDSTSSVTKSLTFNNRTVCLIWFRLKSGSAGPINVSVQAWGN